MEHGFHLDLIWPARLGNSHTLAMPPLLEFEQTPVTPTAVVSHSPYIRIGVQQANLVEKLNSSYAPPGIMVIVYATYDHSPIEGDPACFGLVVGLVPTHNLVRIKPIYQQGHLAYRLQIAHANTSMLNHRCLLSHAGRGHNCLCTLGDKIVSLGRGAPTNHMIDS